jgi:hypothetical protein
MVVTVGAEAEDGSAKQVELEKNRNHDKQVKMI